jgi:hypothetical protein
VWFEIVDALDKTGILKGQKKLVRSVILSWKIEFHVPAGICIDLQHLGDKKGNSCILCQNFISPRRREGHEGFFKFFVLFVAVRLLPFPV